MLELPMRDLLQTLQVLNGEQQPTAFSQPHDEQVELLVALNSADDRLTIEQLRPLKGYD
jgi:hypothetical protein